MIMTCIFCIQEVTIHSGAAVQVVTAHSFQWPSGQCVDLVSLLLPGPRQYTQYTQVLPPLLLNKG